MTRKTGNEKENKRTNNNEKGHFVISNPLVKEKPYKVTSRYSFLYPLVKEKPHKVISRYSFLYPVTPPFFGKWFIRTQLVLD